MQEHVALASHLPHGTQARLQNDVPGFAAKRARAIIKEELGASVGRDRVRVRVRVRVPSSRRSWAPRWTSSSNLTLALALALALTLTLALALTLSLIPRLTKARGEEGDKEFVVCSLDLISG